MTIKIIGGGVIGLSTGVCLNVAGYDTEILAENIPMESGNYRDKSGIASEYATASVKPSTIPNKDLNKMLRHSIKIYNKLLEETNSVEKHPHFMGGKRFETPSFKDVVDNYNSKKSSDYKFPFSTKSGGVFNVHYLHMNDYLPYLIGLYEETGGIIRKTKINNVDKLDDYEYLVNCTGYNSRELFGDESLKPVRGHLAYVDTGFQLKDEKYDGSFSYSYTFDDKKVYCYPHKEMIILGKTAIHEDDNWESYSDYYETDSGEDIPKHIINKNREILKDSIGLDIENYDIHGTSGYRPYREEGIRVEKEGNILHNYGHGGSGVTFSWGSAVKLTNKIEPKKDVIREVKKQIQEYNPF